MADPQSNNPPVTNPDDREPTRAPHGGSTGERLHERGVGYDPSEREKQRPNTGGRKGGHQDERLGNLGGGNQGDR